MDVGRCADEEEDYEEEGLEVEDCGLELESGGQFGGRKGGLESDKCRGGWALRRLVSLVG